MANFEYKVEVRSIEDRKILETVVLSFEPVDEIPLGVMIDNRDNSTGEMWDMLIWGLPDQLDVLKRVRRKDLRPMLDAWQASEGITVGESDASSASSTDTVRHSKPTSSKTDSD